MAGVKCSAEVIEDQLKKCSIKRDVDVSELYIARKGLTEVIDLSRFKMLKYLWLNHNKIRKITCLTNNYRLSELYLNNNELVDIAGALKHLTTLQILMLHNNQLTNLETTVKELKEMTCLQILNLFQNPLSQDSVYRLYVICLLPSVQLFDRRRVTEKEKEAAVNVFTPERAHVLQTLAFGRKIDTILVPRKPSKNTAQAYKSKSLSDPEENLPCKLLGPLNGQDARHSEKFWDPTLDSNREFVNNLHSIFLDNPEDAVFWKAMQRSIMQFSFVDWSTIPTSKQKRLEDKATKTPQLLTVQFR
ncbi:leucine-rich repeat-containing protein 72 isoform X2 [Rhinatrema bivittatum]|uniref:leucine-rich repeat-containing protein 72 isoform X2 n=1 Tax=Rhinatrema bivittatum TaxID=194408 RepID=UPI00112CF6C4|nr:leucine-rich repeat-containing protein 72 isoform X2 [Rhinatrema bivittatum]